MARTAVARSTRYSRHRDGGHVLLQVMKFGEGDDGFG